MPEPKQDNNANRITVRLDEDVFKAVTEIADKQNRTPSNTAETIVTDWARDTNIIPRPKSQGQQD